MSLLCILPPLLCSHTTLETSRISILGYPFRCETVWDQKHQSGVPVQKPDWNSASVLLCKLPQVIFPLWPSVSSSVRALSDKKKNVSCILYILGWPKSLFGFFCKIIWQNSNELFGQPNNWKLFSSHFMKIKKKQRKVVLIIDCCSVAKLCPTLCNSTDCSTQGFPVLHYLLQFVQTHVHRVGDTISPSHPLSPPSPSAFSLSQHQGLFQ